MFLHYSEFPATCVVFGGRLLHLYIQREDLFREKLLLDQREFFCTESDIKIRKMEENRFANFSISVEDYVESLKNKLGCEFVDK